LLFAQADLDCHPSILCFRWDYRSTPPGLMRWGSLKVFAVFGLEL
jgi:hypothetical protein